jgi:hypothetical protein
MLTKERFLQGIKYLQCNYVNWQFDLNNDMMINVWYNKFKNLEDITFTRMLEIYTNTNIYPPNSPIQLIDTLDSGLIRNHLASDEAWNKVLELIRDYGFYYNSDKIYKAIENDKALTRTVQEYESELRTLQSGDQNIPLRFKKSYELNLKRDIVEEKETLLGINITNMLDTKTILKIDNKKLIDNK